MTQRLARVCIACLRQKTLNANRGVVKTSPRIWTRDLKAFGTGPKSPDDDESDSEPSPIPTLSRLSGGASDTRRRRPLSPLERVSQLLPQNALSEEVWSLRGNAASGEEGEPDEHTLEQTTVAARRPAVQIPGGDGGAEVQVQDGDVVHREDTEEQSGRVEIMDAPPHTLLPGERMMCFGELLMAECRRRRRQGFQKMFQLQEGVLLQSNWGVIPHETIRGRPAGVLLYTNLGHPMMIRRPSLEEFTLFMGRAPAISYPKDVSAMLMMMDVSEGDCVLESGSGSGAMSLFLSRAVASRGSVLSVEVRKDHHKQSKKNYQHWRSTWRLRTGEEWPDNVHFHHGDLITSEPFLAGRSFNSIALDMVNPHLAFPVIVPHLHNGGVCAVYLANITQIIDLKEALRCSALPLVCERIIEVQHRDWLLAPSFKKDASFNKRKALSEAIVESEEDNSNDEEREEQAGTKHAPFGSVPYIARPHPEQVGHTAFLVKLRKILK